MPSAYLGLFTTYEGLKYSARKELCLQSPAEFKYEELDKDNRQMKIASLLNFKNFGGTRISKDK